MCSWKRYRQMTLSFNDSNGSPENGWSKFFSNFPPTTQHNHKGNNGSYFYASNGCLSNSDRIWSPASLFTRFCLQVIHSPFFSHISVIYSNNALQPHYLWTQWCWGTIKALGKTVKKEQFSITSPANPPSYLLNAMQLQYTCNCLWLITSSQSGTIIRTTLCRWWEVLDPLYS